MVLRYVRRLFSQSIILLLAGCSIQGEITEEQALQAEILFHNQTQALTVLSPQDIYTNQDPIQFAITFNRDVEKIVKQNISLENASLISIESRGNNDYWLKLAPRNNGVVTMQLQKGFAIDKTGTPSRVSDKVALIFDNLLPAITNVSVDISSRQIPTRPIINLATEPNTEIKVYSSSTCTGTEVHSSKTSPTSGTTSVQTQNLGADGTYVLSIFTRDPAGNEFCLASAVNYILDTIAPVLIVLTPVSQDTFTNGTTITGLCETGLDVTIAGSGVAAPTIVPCLSGSFGASILFSSGDGLKDLTVSQTDLGHNQTSIALQFNSDSTPPTWVSIVSAATIQRDETLTIPDASIQTSEEGSGTYSLLASASIPQCASHGNVSIDAATGELTFIPAPNYYNKNNATNYNGGPCHVLVEFADQVQPTPFTVTQEILVTVEWDNGVDNPPEIPSWPGNNGLSLETCGDKCFANSTFDLAFVANPGGGTYPDPQAVTCSATTSDTYHIEAVDCTVTNTNGLLSLMMGAAHPNASDTTEITLTVSDGVQSVTRTFSIHVIDYVVNMYPALATSTSMSCILCHANIQADIVSDFGVSKTNYHNASNILGGSHLNSSHLYHESNESVNFMINGSLYMPNITVTDRNFIKQTTGNPSGAAINLINFLQNPFTLFYGTSDLYGTPLYDGDGTFTLSGVTASRMAPFPAARLTGGIRQKTSVTIRSPSSAEILKMAPALTAGVTAFHYSGPGSKPTLSGLEVFSYGNYGNGDHKFVRNNGTIVCHGTIVVSGPLYLKNPDLQTDELGCSIYVDGHVFIETDRAHAIQYVGGNSAPSLQLSSSYAVHMGIGLHDMTYDRNTGARPHADRIANDANPSGLKDAGGRAVSIKSNGDAGALEFMTCPLGPTIAIYLDGHYLSPGNYQACKGIANGYNCATARSIFDGWEGPVTNYDHVSSDRNVFNGSLLVDVLTAYETMCRSNSGYQMTNYAGFNWDWAGTWGELPDRPGAATINSYRQSTRFDHFRVNGASVHSRYYGTFNGSVITPYALFAVGNLVFTYDTRLDSLVPFARLANPHPIFKVED